MKLASLVVAALFLAVFSVGGHAQDDDIEKHPGYISLDDIEIPETCESVTDISLGPALLRVLSKSQGEPGDDESSNLLSIRVKSYESDSLDLATLQPVIERIEKKLKKEKWERIVHVVEGDERTTVSIKHDKENVLGLLVVSIEPNEEVTFINIVGSFDLEDLEDFDLDLDDAALDSLRESMDD